MTTVTVTIPGTATVPQAFTYSLSLNTDEVDPYTYLDGGITLDARASIPTPVKIKFWIPGYLDEKWEDKDGKLNISLPSGSPLYTEADWYGYGPVIYWFTDDYVHLYPYGKDSGVDISDFEILTSYGPQWYSARKSGSFYLAYLGTADGSVANYWVSVYFQFE